MTKNSVSGGIKTKTVKISGTEYNIYGPFSFSCATNYTSANPKYTLDVRNSSNGKITSAKLCDSSNKNISSLSCKNGKSCTFYVKIPKRYCKNGVNSVKIIGKYTVNRKTEKRIKFNAIYKPTNYNEEWYQHIRTGDTIVDTVPNRNKKGKIITTKSSVEKEIKWTLNGSLTIIKRDADDPNIKLAGVKIKINNTEYTTNADGEIFIEKGLANGKTYTITEISNPNYGYKISNTINLGTVTFKNGLEQTVAYSNTKQTGNLKIKKTDKDTNEELGGIGFKLKDSTGKYIKVTGQEDDVDEVGVLTQAIGTAYITNMTTVNSANDATEFFTDDKGQIVIYNLLVGKYTIEETSLGENTEYLLDKNNIFWEVTNGIEINGISADVNISRQKSYNTVINTIRDTNITTNVNAKNKKPFIKLSGNVWEDVAEGKDSIKDSLFGSNDIKIRGIKVTLKNSDGTNVEKVKEDSKFVNPVYTDENGHYCFEDVLTINLSDYYIEFEYDGQLYTTVKDYTEIPASTNPIANISGNTSVLQLVNNNNNGTENTESEDTTIEENTSNLNNIEVMLKYADGDNLVQNTIVDLIDDGIETELPFIDNDNNTSTEEDEQEETKIVLTLKTQDEEEIKRIYANDDGSFDFEYIIPWEDRENYYVEYAEEDNYENTLDSVDITDIEDDENNYPFNVSGNVVDIFGGLVNDEVGEVDDKLINPAYTDEEGNYYFNYIPINSNKKLEETYYIEYTYEGVTYKTTKPFENLDYNDNDNDDNDDDNNINYIDIYSNIIDSDNNENSSNTENQVEEVDLILGNIKVTIQDEKGNNITGTVTTGDDGKYSFNNIPLNGIEKYKIKFVYEDNNGTEQVIIKPISELGCDFRAEDGSLLAYEKNTSKAQEEEAQRNALDNNYATISENGEVKIDEKTSQSKVNGNSGEFIVNYNSVIENGKDAKSQSKNRELFNKQLDENRPIRRVDQFNSYENYDKNRMIATTKVSNYGVLGSNTLDTIFMMGLSEITGINCGLVEREQVDLSVSTDLESVEVNVNGYSNTYTYGACKNNYNDEEDFRLDVKMKKWGYERMMYASDIKKMDEETCKVFMTYSITIRNNSNTLSAKVNKLANHYYSSYSVVDSWIEEDNNKKQVTWSTSLDNQGYKLGYTENLPEMRANERKTIYIKYELSNDDIVRLLSDVDEYSISNVTEITSYTSFYGDNTYYHTGKGSRSGIYASIDKDSAPGNAIIGNGTTYEDDTMASPTLTMKLYTNERTITGNVFEDIKTDGLLGNGKYDNDIDRQVGNVTVELYEYLEPQTYNTDEGNTPRAIFTESIGSIAKIVTKTSSGYDVSSASTKSNEDGSYSISGMRPGNYVLKFTYGNGNVIYSNGQPVNNLRNANLYKSTIIKSPVVRNALEKINKEPSMWYKQIENDNIGSSIAVDDLIAYNNGNTLGNDTKTITHSTQSNLLETKSAYSAPVNMKFELVDNNNDGIADIDSYNSKETVTKVNIDGTKQVETVLKYLNDNLNFGIFEKPKQSYEVKKEITHIKITLANGQVLIEGDPRSQEIKYTKYLKHTPFNRADTVNMEIDNELIVGATLEATYEVSIENTSEENYHIYEYYYFGDKPINAIPDSIKVNIALDYIDNELVYNKKVNGEQFIGKIAVNDEGKDVFMANGSRINDKEAQDYLYDEVIQVAKKYNNLLILESDGDNQTWTYTANKLLAASSKLEFNNYVEAIEITAVGQPTNDNILGDFNPETDSYKVNKTYEGQTDYYAKSITITNPTGANKNIIVLLIASTSLVILAGGIWIIKTKIL